MIINGHRYCTGCMKELLAGMDRCSCGFDDSSYQNPPQCLPVGTVLDGGYIIGRVMGAGGFGITYMGLDVDLNLRVAIKEFYMNSVVSRDTTISNEVLTTQGEEEELFTEQREKFIEEGKVLARLYQEPGVVTVHRYLQQNNTAYIVMEFLEGEDLKHYLQKKGRLTGEEMLQTLLPVLRSLEKVHELGLIHRDISPDNIMLTKNGNVKLLDFGAARDSGEDRSLTIMLKHGFAPFEQYLPHGRNQGPWTDVYAMAATMYLCLTGEIPKSAGERMDESRSGIKTPSPMQLGAACNQSMSNVIMKGLAVRLEDRYATMRDFRIDLERALAGEEIAFSEASTTQQQSEGEQDGAETVGTVGKKRKQKAKQISLIILMGGALLFAGLLILVGIACWKQIMTTKQDGAANNTDYKPVVAKEKEPERVHEKVTFGVDGREWYILEETQDSMLLLSVEMVEARPFKKTVTTKKITWENCDLRSYLNSTYLESAFSKEEQARILSTQVEYAEGAFTEDSVFLLSYEEAKHYLDRSERKCSVPREMYEQDNGWWLRDNIFSETSACTWYVKPNGYLADAPRICSMVCGVRPAMWVKKE